jgi:hypothetical protein
VHPRSDGSGAFLLPRLGPAEQNHQGAMAVGLRGPKLELRCTICDEVSSYVIYKRRGVQFAHLPRWKRPRESRRRESGSSGHQRRWGRSPVALRLQGLLRQRWCRWGSSFKRRIGAGVSGAAARWQCRGSAMVARVLAKSARDRALLIGVFAPNHGRQKS